MERENLPLYEYTNSFLLEGTWKGVKNSWSHSLHKICSRTGSFPPCLARYFVERFSESGNKVLDPFSGKGTTPLEACISRRVGIGNDLSPEAYILTHAKVKPVSLTRISEYLYKIKGALNFQKVSLSDINDNIGIFFHPETLKQIVALRETLEHESSDESIFLKALMCGIIHGASEVSLSLPCSHSFSMSPAYVRKYARKHRLRKPKKNVINCLKLKAENVLRDGVFDIRGEAYHSNAAQLPVEEQSIDLIVTSPPYFNKQTYAWDNWLRLWFLGFDYKEVRKRLFQTGSKEKFVEFMTGSLKEMYRVLKENSACFIVVGDVLLNGEMINTAELLVKPAECIGFKVRRIINDEIPRTEKYFMFISSDKGVRLDRILELHKGDVYEKKVRLPWRST